MALAVALRLFFSACASSQTTRRHLTRCSTDTGPSAGSARRPAAAELAAGAAAARRARDAAGAPLASLLLPLLPPEKSESSPLLPSPSSLLSLRPFLRARLAGLPLGSAFFFGGARGRLTATPPAAAGLPFSEEPRLLAPAPAAPCHVRPALPSSAPASPPAAELDAFLPAAPCHVRPASSSAAALAFLAAARRETGGGASSALLSPPPSSSSSSSPLAAAAAAAPPPLPRLRSCLRCASVLSASGPQK